LEVAKDAKSDRIQKRGYLLTSGKKVEGKWMATEKEGSARFMGEGRKITLAKKKGNYFSRGVREIPKTV